MTNAKRENPNKGGQKDPKISRLRFRTADFADEDRRDALETFGKGLYTYTPTEHGGECPKLDVDAWVLSDVCVASIGHGPQREFTPKVLDSSFEDKALLRWTRTGRVQAVSMDQTTELEPGSIALVHPQHHLQKSEAGSGLSLRLPYNEIGYDPSCFDPIVKLPHDRWQVRVLLSAIEALLEALPLMDAKDAQPVSRQLTSMVKAVLDLEKPQQVGHASLKANRKHAMRRFLTKNLSRRDLSISHLQSEFGASKATVYRAFEDVGGVANFLRDQRFAAACRDLRQSRPERGAVRHIAEQNGFWDQTNFTRMFRKRYGVRPSEVLGTEWMQTQEDIQHQKHQVGRSPSLASFWTRQRSHSTM